MTTKHEIKGNKMVYCYDVNDKLEGNLLAHIVEERLSKRTGKQKIDGKIDLWKVCDSSYTYYIKETVSGNFEVRIK